MRNFPTLPVEAPGPTQLELHAAYGLSEITAAFGLATLESPGPKGVGVIPVERIKTYIHLVTFEKEERDFSPTTLYRDYPADKSDPTSLGITSGDCPENQNRPKLHSSP